MAWREVKAVDLKKDDLIYHEGGTVFVHSVVVDGGSVALELNMNTSLFLTKPDLYCTELCFDDVVRRYEPEGEQLPWREGASDETNNKAHKGETIYVEDVVKDLVDKLKDKKGGKKHE